MTREEAISQLISLNEEDVSVYSDAVEYAINALEQEPCEDAISRKAVLDLCDSKDPDYKVIHFKEDVECLSPVNPQPKTWHWIPVTERLPDIHNYCVKYLVTDCNGNIYTSLFTESGGKSWWSHEDIIAWMPLPEPYKASPTGTESESKDADSN